MSESEFETPLRKYTEILRGHADRLARFLGCSRTTDAELESELWNTGTGAARLFHLIEKDFGPIFLPENVEKICPGVREPRLQLVPSQVSEDDVWFDFWRQVVTFVGRLHRIQTSGMWTGTGSLRKRCEDSSTVLGILADTLDERRSYTSVPPTTAFLDEAGATGGPLDERQAGGKSETPGEQLQIGVPKAEAVITPKRPTAGMPRHKLVKKAEQWVKKHNGKFPGVNSLAKILDAAQSSLSKAIKDSSYLKARKAEHEAERKGKPRETQMTDMVLDGSVQATERDPQNQAALNELVAEQQMDIDADNGRASRCLPSMHRS